MPLFFFLAACLALVLIGVGIVAAAVAAVAIAVLITLGITSSAVMIGLLRRKLSSGFRAFHYQLCVFIGIPAGVGALGCADWFLGYGIRPGMILAVGGLGGACAGLVLAFVCDQLARILYRRFVQEPDPAAVPAAATRAELKLELEAIEGLHQRDRE